MSLSVPYINGFASLVSVKQLISQAITILPQGANLLFHLDRGWHYRQHCIKNILANNGITQSASRRGGCYDNAIVEIFFATL